jgi:hypothetical protein
MPEHSQAKENNRPEDPQEYGQRVQLPRDKLRTEMPQQRVCGDSGAFGFGGFGRTFLIDTESGEISTGSAASGPLAEGVPCAPGVVLPATLKNPATGGR